MLDAALFLVVITMFVMGLRRPFLWVLAYLYIDILAPQKMGWTLTQLFPISFIAFILAFVGWAFFDRKSGTRINIRQIMLIVLLVWCFITLQWAQYADLGVGKWDWVWRALVFAIFLPFTLTTRLRIEAVALIMVLTAGAIIISAGIKTATGGGGYGHLYLFVNDNSNIYESSTLSTVAIAIIPIILWLMRYGTVYPPDWRVRLFGGALIFACLLIPIGTEARTGLICIVVLGALMLRDVKHRFRYIAAAAFAGLLAIPFLPASYTERMATIGEADSDQSASTRLQVWEWTFNYSLEHPLGGGFDAYRANSFTYMMPVREVDGNSVSVEYVEVTDSSRAYHSSWFEMLGEQGWPGLILWVSLQFSGLIQLEKVRRRYKGETSRATRWIAPMASALQFSGIIYLVGATFQGIAYQPFILMLIGLQIGVVTYCQRRESAIAEAERKAILAEKRHAKADLAAGDPAMP